MQQSKNVERYNSLEGVDGENCYILLKCRKSRLKLTKLAKNKTPLIEQLAKFLAANALDKLKVGTMICRMDKSKDLGKSIQICKLLSHYGYSIEPTATGKSRQNGFVVVENREIGRRLQYMYYGSNMKFKYQPHSLNHSIWVDNISLYTNDTQVPLTNLTNKTLDIKHLRTWGCYVWVHDNVKCNRKIALHRRKGWFLEYSSTMANIIYLDGATD